MTYANCTDAKQDGVYNIPSTHPSYQPKLDSDLDGMACETPVKGGEDLSNWQADVTPTPSQTVSSSPTTSASVGVSESPTSLPVTGSSENGMIAGTGAGIVLIGAILFAAARKRYQGQHR